jgi:hypothetical protein
MTSVALRRATPADCEFCFQLHKAAMGGYTMRSVRPHRCDRYRT